MLQMVKSDWFYGEYCEQGIAAGTLLLWNNRAKRLSEAF
jgi:hypothetical protein